MAVSIDPDSKFLGVLDFIKEAGSGVHQNPWDNIRDKVGGLLYDTLVEPQEYQTPIFDTGQTQQFADTHNAMLPERGSKQSMLLPFGYDAQGNIEPAIPSLARDVGLGAFGLLGEYEKAQTGTGYGSLDDITPQEAANSMQGLLEVMTGGLIDNAPKSVRSGLSRGGDNIVTGAERDANLKNWFGDSKVVDEAGKPLTVYHGGYGAKDIEVFNPMYGGETTGNNLHGAFHFTDNLEVAEDYGRQSFNRRFQDNPESLVDEGLISKVKEFDDYNEQYDFVADLAEDNIQTQSVHLNIENPYILDMKGERVDVQQIEELGAGLKAMGDGDWSNVPEEAMETILEMGKYNPSDIEDYTDEIAEMLLEDYDIPSIKEADEWELNSVIDEVLSEAGIEKEYPEFDGIIIKNMIDDIGDMSRQVADQFIVFDPKKIKSIHNRGTYNPKDANILKGIAPIAGAGLLGAGMMQQEEQQPQQGILN